MDMLITPTNSLNQVAPSRGGQMRGEGSGSRYTTIPQNRSITEGDRSGRLVHGTEDSKQRETDLAAWMRAVGTANYAPGEEHNTPASQSDLVRSRQMRSRLESTYSNTPSRNTFSSEDKANEAEDESAVRVDYLV